MYVDNRKILIAIGVITLLTFPLVAATTGALRIAFVILFALFFPGYALLSALFPRRNELGGIERVALSVGLSIAVVVLAGLVLNYTAWGIRLYPVLISITLLIFTTSAIAYYRQLRLPAADRFGITLKFNLPKWLRVGNLDKALYICLAAAIVLALGCIGYVMATPTQGERFTEFYILNAEGEAENYPQQVVLGEPVDVILGVVNHEHELASYRVDIEIDGTWNKTVNIGALSHDEKWEEVISFIPQAQGESQRVEFWLYKDGEARPYLGEPLHLYIHVSSPISFAHWENLSKCGVFSYTNEAFQ